MPLTREQILAKQDDKPTYPVEIPEWGDSILVRTLSSGQRIKWILLQRDNNKIDSAALLVVLAAVGEDGSRLFPQVQDVDAVTELRGDVVQRIAEKVMEISGMSDTALSDAEGKSETAPSSDTPSTSPSESDAPSES